MIGTVDQLFTLADLLEVSWKFAHPVFMCFVDLEKAYKHVPTGSNYLIPVHHIQGQDLKVQL